MLAIALVEAFAAPTVRDVPTLFSITSLPITGMTSLPDAWRSSSCIYFRVALNTDGSENTHALLNSCFPLQLISWVTMAVVKLRGRMGEGLWEMYGSVVGGDSGSSVLSLIGR